MARWGSLVAPEFHALKVVGSNPTLATLRMYGSMEEYFAVNISVREVA